VPVYYHCTAFHKLSVEAPYHALTNGGHISYVEMDGDPLIRRRSNDGVVQPRLRGHLVGVFAHRADDFQAQLLPA